MPNLLPDEYARRAEIAKKHTRPDGTVHYVNYANEVGIDAAAALRGLRTMARKGLLGFKPIIQGFEVASITTRRDKDGGIIGESIVQRPESGEPYQVPEGHVVKGYSTLVDADGNKRAEWVKTREGIDPKKTYDDLVKMFAAFEPAAKPRPAPAGKFEDQLVVYPFADPHFGLYVWGREASENWDLQKAVSVMLSTFARVVARTPRTNKAILIVGGDTMHADNNSNKTPVAGNPLQVDGRYPKVLATAAETLAKIVNMLLGTHKSVEVIVLPGNHDEHSAHALALVLRAWFRNEKRVKVDDDPSLYRFREFGKVMIGTTHGHAAKPADMPQIMAAREAAIWGRTEHRYIHTFHVHNQSKAISEIGGCLVETHRIVAPQDAWHWSEGYLSGRSLQSISYDREHGEVARAVVNVPSASPSRGKVA